MKKFFPPTWKQVAGVAVISVGAVLIVTQVAPRTVTFLRDRLVSKIPPVA